MSIPLPDKAADTTAEQPWPVRLLSMKIAEYVDRMSVTWVEGQVVQLTRRPGARTAWLTLRDPDVDMSLSCMVRVTALDAMLAKGDHSVDKVLELVVDDEVVVQRLLKRAELEGRVDDTEEVIRERMAIYHRETKPLSDAYGERNLLVQVDGEGEVDEVAERIVAALGA